MSRFKVLELPTYLRSDLGRELFEEERKLGYHIEIEPRFKRDGVYVDRMYVYRHNSTSHLACWVEYDDGTKAVAYNLEMFEYNLSLENHTSLLPKERDAILTLIRANLASKELKQLYYLDDRWREIRNVGRDTRKYMIQFLKERN